MTDHRMRMRRMLFETWGYPHRASFGDYDPPLGPILVRAEVRSCTSTTFTTAEDQSTAMRSSRGSGELG